MQSEATIIAIVVTLSLVVVQLTASAYSPKVTEIFRESPDFWVMIFIYTLAIMCCLAVLGTLDEDPVFPIEKSTKICIILGIFCFWALIPYAYLILIMLRPFNIIRKLVERITKEYLLRGDPIYPIFDIVRISIVEYDLEATREATESVSGKMEKILRQKDRFPRMDEQMIANKLLKHPRRAIDVALDKSDEESALALMRMVSNIGGTAASLGYGILARKSAYVLGYLGREATSPNRCLRWITLYTVGHLGILAMKATENNLPETKRMVLEDLRKIVIKAKKCCANCDPIDSTEWTRAIDQAESYIRGIETDFNKPTPYSNKEEVE